MAVKKTEAASTKPKMETKLSKKSLKKSKTLKESKKKSKKKLEEVQKEQSPPPPLVRYEEPSDEEKPTQDNNEENEGSKEPITSKKWTNRQRVLVFSSRGLQYRDRHLMEDLRSMMPHSKSESKMQRRDSLFHINEMAEMKNCSKSIFFEGRVRRRDTYLWLSNITKGPSAKFQLENVHTTAELKMTGNCLKTSRPLLSFHPEFAKKPHLKVIKELLIQIFGVPNHHPRSQPFFDHVFVFSLTSDERIWFRNFAILDESDASLAEIGPRFTLNPIKVFENSFSGRTLWSNPDYVTPTAKRILIRRAKAGRYRHNVENKAGREARKPEISYKMDPLDEVFNTGEYEEPEEDETHVQKLKQGTKKNAKKALKRKDARKSKV